MLTNLTLLIYTDGALMFRSSSHTLWSVSIATKELSSALRYVPILLYLLIKVTNKHVDSLGDKS